MNELLSSVAGCTCGWSPCLFVCPAYAFYGSEARESPCTPGGPLLARCPSVMLARRCGGCADRRLVNGDNSSSSGSATCPAVAGRSTVSIHSRLLLIWSML